MAIKWKPSMAQKRNWNKLQPIEITEITKEITDLELCSKIEFLYRTHNIGFELIDLHQIMWARGFSTYTCLKNSLQTI